jgi:hypothetical protein
MFFDATTTAGLPPRLRFAHHNFLASIPTMVVGCQGQVIQV